MKILVIDPDRAILRTIVLHIGPLHQVDTATSLAEGREKAAMNVPDLVILEVLLPDGTVLDLVEEMWRAGHFPRVVLLTGHGEPEVPEEMRSRGLGSIQKPIDLDALDQVISEVWYRSNPVAPLDSFPRRKEVRGCV